MCIVMLSVAGNLPASVSSSCVVGFLGGVRRSIAKCKLSPPRLYRCFSLDIAQFLSFLSVVSSLSLFLIISLRLFSP